jgi:hypothetical protein
MNIRALSVIFIIFIILGCAAKKSVESLDTDIDKDAVHRDDLLWVFKPNINIRDSASGSGTKLASLEDGDSVIVITNDNGWYQIKTIEGMSGWVRSDLLGPKELSAFSSAVIFIEEMKENENIEIYFDKNLYHKRIYISFPPDIYSSQQEVETKTRDIVNRYQSDVYRGHVTARVLKQPSEKGYLTIEVKGAVNADPILPVVPFGRIEHVDRSIPSGIRLSYSTPSEISDKMLISTARQIVPNFPISYQRVEITFKNSPYSNEEPCRLWYMEDANGEEFKLNRCE